MNEVLIQGKFGKYLFPEFDVRVQGIPMGQVWLTRFPGIAGDYQQNKQKGKNVPKRFDNDLLLLPGYCDADAGLRVKENSTGFSSLRIFK